MDSIFAIKYKGGVLLASETTINHSIFKLKKGGNKVEQLDSHCLMGLAGDNSDRDHFRSYIKRNVEFFKFKSNGQRSSVSRSAQFVRGELAKAIRKSMKQVSPLVVGFDERRGPQVYWLDYLGTLCDVNYGVHGYSAYFLNSVLASGWREDLTYEEAVQLAKDCIKAIKARFIIHMEGFDIWVIDENGHRKEDHWQV
jgi:20S proteasome subunit beta 4